MKPSLDISLQDEQKLKKNNVFLPKIISNNNLVPEATMLTMFFLSI